VTIVNCKRNVSFKQGKRSLFKEVKFQLLAFNSIHILVRCVGLILIRYQKSKLNLIQYEVKCRTLVDFVLSLIRNLGMRSLLRLCRADNALTLLFEECLFF